MSRLLNTLQTNDSVTHNGMPTHSTSLNKNVDFFFLAGASRNLSDRDLHNLFEKAFGENKLNALRILFWARDVRGGAGERRLFEVLIKYIAERYPEYLFKTENFKLIPEFGRWKDLLVLLNDEKYFKQVIDLIKAGLADDNTKALAAKWLPRKGALSAKIRNGLDMSPKEYRKTIVELSKGVIETAMAAGKYEDIDYSKVPSIAFNKYRKAFERNDPKRFNTFLESLEKGETKVNASTIFPHQLYKQIKNGTVTGSERKSIVEQWKAMPNYIEGNDERILTVVDTSGSMCVNIDKSGTQAMDVSVALGLYFSERMEGAFKDYFITFSDHPTLQHLSGDLFARANQLQRANWGYSTNLESVFNLILTKAKQGKLSDGDMPTKVLILSDMEFNSAVKGVSDNAFQMIRKRYKEAGFEMPQVIFWNLNGRIGNVPAHENTKHAALLSGFSPATLQGVLGAEVLTPKETMMNVLDSERYSAIKSL